MCIAEIHDKDIVSFPKQGHESKPTKTKTFASVEALKRAIWNVLTMGCFIFVLEFLFGGVSLVPPCCSPSYLRGFWIHGRLPMYAASLLWPKQDYLKGHLAMSHDVLWTCRVCRDAHLEYRKASVRVIQTAHLSIADQPIAKRMPRKEQLFLLISFKFY